MKITKSKFVYITEGKYPRPELPKGNVERDKWIEYIESHKDIFMWYEDTPDGKEKKENFDQIPDSAKEWVLYRLNKAWAYTIDKKLAKHSDDLIFKYNVERKTINVHREKKVTIPVAELILDMAKFLDSKVVVNGKIFESIDELE
jgi:hypothetical protein